MKKPEVENLVSDSLYVKIRKKHGINIILNTNLTKIKCETDYYWFSYQGPRLPVRKGI
jgi:hypothetical protein